MNLRQRLAGPLRFRPTTAPAPRPRQTGFVRDQVRVPTAQALGRSSNPASRSSASTPAGLWPAGFDRLTPPSADVTSRGLVQVDGQPQRGPTPAIAFDLETTGTSFGSVVPFIVGMAWHDRDQVVVMQWTLEHPSGERPMLLDVLRTLEATAGPATRLVTFNGASFDVPVMRRRLGRLGLPPLPGLAHVDLLTAARRLWRGVFRDCRLTTLESMVLKIQRRGDLEGAEVAEVFPQWLERPDDPWTQAQMVRAKQHNRADVVGLLALVAAAGGRLREPGRDDELGRRNPAEVLRAGRHFKQLGQFEQALERLGPLVSRPAPASTQPRQREVWRSATLLAADLERRLKRSSAAAGLWRSVCDAFPGDDEAHECLAKHLEHVERRYADALAVARSSRCPCERRVARLERKLAASGRSERQGRGAGGQDPPVRPRTESP